MQRTQSLVLARSLLLFGAWAFGVGCASAPRPEAAPKPVVVAQPPAKVPADPLAAANKSFEAGEYDTARAGFLAAVSAHPEDATANFNLGVTEQRLGHLEQAKAAYQKVLSLDNGARRADAACNLGVILRNEGGDDEALALYRKALKAAPHHACLLNNLSVLLRKRKAYDESIAALRSLLMRDQNNVDAYKNLALVYVDQKKFKLAQTILENALKMLKDQGRTDANVYVDLGLVFAGTKEPGRAMAAFKSAIAIDPENLVANSNIGALALAHRDYQRAAQSYEIVVKRTPNDPVAVSGLGYAYQGLQRWPDAARALEQAHDLMARSPAVQSAAAKDSLADDGSQILLQLMIIYQNANDADRALKWGSEYMKAKGLSCGPDEVDGFCGRMNGVKLMKSMDAQPSPEPAAPKATGRDIFTEGQEEPVSSDGAAAPDASDSAVLGAGASSSGR